MKKGLLVVWLIIFFGVGLILGVYLTRISNEDMMVFIEEEALRLVCSTSYQQDRELLQYYHNIEQEMQSSCCDSVKDKVSEVNLLLKKKISVMEGVCESAVPEAP